ncbi:MAG: PQQ-dependent sugar dehydrogenase, partial [Actinobacteria bacterium]|nr:PQQ-dependent sugar dehydrogenase [Actinomycetota bacterium]
AGTLQVVNTDGTLQKTPQGTPAPFLDISSKVTSAGERGLLGVPFDPDFANNPYVYVYYTTVDTTVHNRVARFTASEDSSGNLVAATNSETPIFELPPLSATNHNGGTIHLGTDGKLYVAVGENARPAAAQSLNTVLGKMLRINKDGTIPDGTDAAEANPFLDKTTGDNQAIWALGLRNPYSFDVQPVTGRIFINDVGQDSYEEINDGRAGTNYGWPAYEGPVSNYTVHRSKKHHHHRSHHRRHYYTGPLLYAYTHSSGCAITDGAFYNPDMPTFSSAGDYFFADFCGGWINKYDPDTDTVTGFKSRSGEQPVDLKVRNEGDLYFLARGTGSVEKISYTP